uniref:GDNF inducible zinc finger protein 1 n=1 Tax=Tetraodon nigroviridis TaxID=99883 RepID=H3CZF5_TETNG
MGGGVIELTAKNYHKNLLASLQLLRLQGLLSDVTVQVDYQGDVQVFQAHRVMLAASSGYFREHLLAADSAAQGELLLSNMHVNYFSKFLEFVYTGKVEISKDKIADVLAAALRLDCKDLAEVCGEAMTVGILEDPTKKSSAKKVEDTGHLRGTKRKALPHGSHAPQSPESEVQVQKSAASDRVAHKKRQINTLKLCFGGRKVLQRRVSLKRAEVQGDNNVTDEDNHDGGQAGSLSKISEDGEEESNLEEPVLPADEWTRQEDEQSNDTENDLAEKEVASKAQFQCNKCQRTFHYERSYLKHISTYHGVKADVVHRCVTCQQTFANQSNLKIHEKHVHSTERLFTCDRCEKTFKRKKDVVRHQRQVHERSNLKYICSDCGKSLSSKTTLALHQRTHTGLRPFECPDCQARFTQKSALKIHRRTHTGEKPFACDHCEARFTQKHMLAYHKRSHTGEKPFMCEACGKSFASKEYLRHHSNIHTGSKPYKCEQCGRCFAQRNSLHQHLKIHTGERPYSCKDCEKQFTQLNALQRHQRIHTGEKPYMCGLCGRTFTDKSTLRRHTTIHDSAAPWKTYLVVLEGN